MEIDNELILKRLMNSPKESLARILTSKMSEEEKRDFMNNNVKWVVEGQWY